MIVYFSGTGNSAYLAELFAESLNEKIVCLNNYIKNNKILDLSKEDRIIVITPTYSWRIPNLVRDYLSSLNSENKDGYFILNCGSDIGNAQKYNKLLSKQMKLNYKGTAAIVMPENYIAMFRAPDKKEAMKIIDRSKKDIRGLINQLKNDEILDDLDINLLDKLKSSIIHDFFFKFLVKDKKFFAKDSCIACGKCVKLCPLNNISMDGKNISWHGNCTHCMACICSCPSEAIEYGSISKNKNRYLCPKI